MLARILAPLTRCRLRLVAVEWRATPLHLFCSRVRGNSDIYATPPQFHVVSCDEMTSETTINGVGWHLSCLFTLTLLMVGCSRPADPRIQGYVEGEFVYIAAPSAGKLVTLNTERGAQVTAGAPLFAIDDTPERALRAEAERRVAQARNKLEDARKGQRPSELESLAAQLQQAKTALNFSESELKRFTELAKSKTATAEEVDQKQNTRDQDRQRVTQLEADLSTAKLGAREDQIAAAIAEVQALEAAQAKSDWDLSQKRQTAGHAGLVFDTLYREGEWVAAGRPVVVLLPPANIKVRAFVPETQIGAIHPGDVAQVRVDGVPEPFAGKVSFISPRAEYTPPVIYSQESRGKLVFLVEIKFEPAVAAKLHPGQPVDVQWKQ